MIPGPGPDPAPHRRRTPIRKHRVKRPGCSLQELLAEKDAAWRALDEFGDPLTAPRDEENPPCL